MRVVLALLAPLMVASIAPAPRAPAPPQPSATVQDQAERNCRGKIEAVREARGLPRLQRDNAQSGNAQRILAVDRQIDGCEVLVMASDPRDVRPLPEFSDGPARLQH
jgi:hypothetical protein